MDIVTTKVVVGILFGVVRFIAGVLPIKIYRCLRLMDDPNDDRNGTISGSKSGITNSRNAVDDSEIIKDNPKNFNRTRREQLVGCMLALFQSFGGGVLFATCLLHMMPAVYYSVDELRHYGVLTPNYPYSQLIVSSGFFLVYFVEEISQYIISITPQVECKNIRKKSLVPSRSVTPIGNGLAIKSGFFDKDEDEKDGSYKTENLKNEFEKRQGTGFKREENGYKRQENGFKRQDNVYEKEEKGLVRQIAFIEPSSPNKVPYIVDVAYENGKNFEQSKVVPFDSELEQVIHSNINNETIEEEQELEQLLTGEIKTQRQILRCFLIVVALSLHAIFEGLAIGLQQSIANIWYLFIAVSIHSATILFCMGLELLKAKAKIRTIVIHVLILSVTSPLGIFMGLAISLSSQTDNKAKSIAVVVLEGLSAGTILYITFFEVLNREKELRVYRLRRAVMIIAGFTLMAALESFELYD